jgi:hypothetical protein
LKRKEEDDVNGLGKESETTPKTLTLECATIEKQREIEAGVINIINTNATKH